MPHDNPQPFDGLPVGELASAHLRLTYLREAGPRIVGLFATGSAENLLAELPDACLDSPHGPYRLRGGHRLWHAPETAVRTYVPDDGGLSVDPLDDGVRLRQPVEAPTGIEKALTIRLDAARPAVTLAHSLRNAGVWPVELAPWAITQLRLGGTAVLPQTNAPLDAEGLQPNRQLILWPYARWQDPRLHLADGALLVRGQPDMPPFKVGAFNHAGWMGYFWGQFFFCKRFTPRLGVPHVDLGANCEIYADQRCLELETLGPLQRLAPGETAVHVERWELYSGFTPPQSAPDMLALAHALLNSAGEI